MAATDLEIVIRDVIKNKIGEKVWDILKDHIKEDIYDEYKPSGKWSFGTPQDSDNDGYKRRKSSGLLDESKKYIQVDKTGGNIWRLRVTSTADPSPSVLGWSWVPSLGGFLAMLEKGDLGFMTSKFYKSKGMVRVSSFPRPAITHAQQEANEHIGEYKKEIYKAISRAMSE